MVVTQLESCEIQRRRDGVLLVRVHSQDRQGRPLPDAVFTFRQGDPQYDYWLDQFRRRTHASAPHGDRSSKGDV
ncbi:MAG: hypothetical protein LLF97_01715 [Planctomycetaceae bacterium]|nr:hypothetical protein [Planctomycetaceae bacterium]